MRQLEGRIRTKEDWRGCCPEEDHTRAESCRMDLTWGTELHTRTRPIGEGNKEQEEEGRPRVKGQGVRSVALSSCMPSLFAYTSPVPPYLHFCILLILTNRLGATARIPHLFHQLSKRISTTSLLGRKRFKAQLLFFG